MDKVNSVAELIERTQGMPLEKMRFFINEDRREPRCFGIYQEADSGYWVVYKNKSDGSRAVRYNGPDEAYAAQELWAKINAEIDLRRARRPQKQKKTAADRLAMALIAAVMAAVIAVAGFLLVRWVSRMPSRGYYLVQEALYYWQDDDWYWYDDGAWTAYDEGLAYDDWHGGTYYGTEYPYFEDEAEAFEATDYYVEPGDDDDADTDADIFDSWDIGDTNWDTDW